MIKVDRTEIIFAAQDQASAVMRAVGSSASTAKAELISLRGAVSGLVGIGVVALFRSMVDSLDALEESAQGAGIAVRSLSGLRYTFSQGGVGANELDDALRRLNVRLADAANGDKTSQGLFKALGVNAVDASGKVRLADEALLLIADRFASFRDGPEKAALAVEIFGRAGARLIPTLNLGRAGIEELRQEAERLGIVIDDKLAGAAGRFNDQLDRLAASSKAGAIALVGPLVEGMSRLIDEYEAAKRAGMGTAETLAFTSKYFNLTGAEAAKAVRDVNKEIVERRRIISEGAIFIDKDELRRELVGLDREKKALQEIFALRRLAETDAYNIPDPNLNRFRPLASAPARPVMTTPKREDISDASEALAAYIKQLDQEIDRIEELSEKEKALKFLQAYPSHDIPQVRELLFERAQLVEMARQERDIQAELGRIQKESIAYSKGLRDEVFRLSGVTDEQRKVALTEQLELMIQLGEVTKDQAIVAVKGIAGIRDEIKETTNNAQELALVLVSSLGRWLDNPTDGARGFFKALSADAKKLIADLIILRPLAEGIRKVFKDDGSTGGGGNNWMSSVGSLLSSVLGNLAGSGGGGQNFDGSWGAGDWGAFGGIGSARGITVNNFIDGATDRARITSLVETGVKSGIAASRDSLARGGSGVLG